MALWARAAVRALRLWGPGVERAWARQPRFVWVAAADPLGMSRPPLRRAAFPGALRGPHPVTASAGAWGGRWRPLCVHFPLVGSQRRRITGGSRPGTPSAGVSGVRGNGGRGETEKLSLQDVAERIRAGACQRVLVMVGAGISTPSGIPDFRSPGSGHYSNLQEYDVPYPEAIFELPFFFHNPKPFFALAKKLYPGHYRPNVIHYFLRLLHDKGLLLRLYTQNIDGLERASGIPASKLVEAHGSFASATCTVCRRTSPGDSFWADVLVDRVPRCSVCTGIVKPDIVFFGEPLPQRFLLHVADFPMADVLLILGTSLQVEPFASLSAAVRSSVPRVLMNRDVVGPLAWCPRSRDVVQLGDLVHSVEKLVELLGWTEEMKDLLQRETGKVGC